MAEDKIDFVSGIILNKKTGDKVYKNDILFELHYNKADIENIVKILNTAYTITEEKPEKVRKILDIME